MLQICLFVSLTLNTFCFTPTPQPVVIEREYIWLYHTTGYYAPLRGQSRYYLGSYEADFHKNCQGSCFNTADWYELSAKDEMAVIACPKTFAIGTKFFIEGLWEVVCHDRWGSIKGKRLDIWNGIGEAGLNNIKTWAFRDGLHKVYIVK